MNGAYGSNVDLEYRYSATQNNGQITQSKDWITGEEVTHTYDALNRLIASSTTDPSWGLSFGYDGFGNRLSQTLTKGSGPTVSLSVNPANNRINSTGYAYDANGNLTTMPNGGSSLTLSYDVENRLVQVTGGGINISYSYSPDNRRVWKTGNGGEEYYFYAPNGDRLGTYQQVSTTHLCGNYWFQPLRTNVYFAGKLVHFKNFTSGAEDAVVLDRLGSVVRGENVSGLLTSYYPYGEQKGADNLLAEKFATYLRDSIYTGLDYAQNRYYAGRWDGLPPQIPMEL
jgi:YD repeat-containing protein